jgi:hypothetical protein
LFVELIGSSLPPTENGFEIIFLQWPEGFKHRAVLGQQPDNGQQPADGQQPGNGQQPDANNTPGGNGGLTLTGETKVINVTDATVITIRSFDPNNQSNTPTTGSLSDITVGSTITVTLAEGSEDQAATIEIMPSGTGGGPNGGQAPQDASSSQA